MERIKIGVVSTRRNVFSKEEAGRLKKIILKEINQFDAEIVDIDDINAEGLLFDEKDVSPVVEKMQKHKVDGLFLPHCNFGSEGLVSQVAARVKKPVLLWGPRDDAPLPDGIRTRDTQCGLFATGKILRRCNVPFTYLTNSSVGDKSFKNGFAKFLGVCAAVKAFYGTRVLQVDTRPKDFMTMIVNEGELLERFGIPVIPVTLPDVMWRMEKILEEKGEDLAATIKKMGRVDCSPMGDDREVSKIAALKCALKELCEEHGCNAVAVQCWDAMQDLIHLMPCMSHGLLTEEGIPTTCETDVHGAITARMLRAAAGGDTIFFADLTVRHPENDNAELLWHCGNFPMDLARDLKKATGGRHFIMPSKCAGTGEWELKRGDITIARFDGDHGEYRLFMGEGRATDGPSTRGTYVWFEVDDWAKWEHQLVCGPYVHHCAGVYAKTAAILSEACKYIPGLTADPAQPTAAEIEDIWLKG
jgi:L-fucose isomerase-like protein